MSRKTNHYWWKRFWSKTPDAIRKLQLFCASVAGTMVAILLLVDQYGVLTDWKDLFAKIALVATGGATFLQFTTKDKNLQDQPNNSL